jgi:hypothetical protein
MISGEARLLRHIGGGSGHPVDKFSFVNAPNFNQPVARIRDPRCQSIAALGWQERYAGSMSADFAIPNGRLGPPRASWRGLAGRAAPGALPALVP